MYKVESFYVGYKTKDTGSSKIQPFYCSAMTPSMLASLVNDAATPLALAAALLTFVYLRSLSAWRKRSRGLPFPPGPSPLPIIGNMLNMPTVRPWEGLRDLCKKHGECTVRI